MSKSDKSTNVQEKFKLALQSTFKVISNDFKIEDNKKNNKSIEKLSIPEIEVLNTKNSFIKARADMDSSALKRGFQMNMYLKKIYHLILARNLFIFFQRK